jgi:hypothetical protein
VLTGEYDAFSTGPGDVRAKGDSTNNFKNKEQGEGQEKQEQKDLPLKFSI